MTANDLIQMERQARAFRDAGELERAIDAFSAIAKAQPDWEHGMCYYEMAMCYEDLGRNGEAEQNFRLALTYDPNYEVYLGGLASFLYVHGHPQDAFDAHLNLIRTFSSHRQEHRIDSLMPAIKNLAAKLGMSELQVQEKMRHVIKCTRELR